ncbi:hypothetical protein BDV96DRAFT_604546 [Lophiotrema nucula]|uniref:Heterokaryon incompatibility domain-containing protein n=1 Tax=Lophiotrema nucula TaxID=690887 RepID=A0A6A5YRB6_9PLEO|nr:hypothetical protein BDV96DRAFT_604546 [Lophiotrema nucula]
MNGAYSHSDGVIAICGDQSLRWSDLALVCEDILRHGGGKYNYSYMRGVPYVVSIGSGGERSGLFEILCRTRSCQATDPRDKFFGILSLVEGGDDEQFHLANYSQSVTMVYTEIGLYLLRKNSLDVLQAIRRPHLSLPNLASWLPDWSNATDNDPFWVDNGQDMWFNKTFFQSIKDNMWYENNGITPRRQILPCCLAHDSSADHQYHPVLSVNGFTISHVRSVGAIFDFQESSVCMEAIGMITESEGDCSSSYLPPGFAPSVQHEGYDFESLFQCYCPIPEASGSSSELKLYEAAMDGYRLVLDDCNHLGVAPQETEVGDKIVFILGAPKFCVLRQRTEGGWILISGECYLPTLRDETGEAALGENYPCLKDGKLNPETKEEFEIW